MKKIILIVSIIFATISATAQQTRPVAKPDEATRAALAERARQCAETLRPLAAETEQRVTEILDKHLMRIAESETAHEANVKFANDSMPPNRRDHVLQNMGNKRKAQLYDEHFSLVRELSVYLDESQIEKLKNALTLGGADEGYNSILTRVTGLTDAEKRWVKAAFAEAREFALDAAAEKQIRQCFDDCTVRVEEQLMLWGYEPDTEN